MAERKRFLTDLYTRCRTLCFPPRCTSCRTLLDWRPLLRDAADDTAFCETCGRKWLIETLGGTAPDYAHSPLLTGEKGKLSKRLGSLNTRTLRREKQPEEVVGQLAFLCGLIDRPDPVSARELIPVFSWAKIVTEDISV